MDIQSNYDEVRSIIEATHCAGCDDPECDHGIRVVEVMDRLLEYDREIEDETFSVCGGTI